MFCDKFELNILNNFMYSDTVFKQVEGIQSKILMYNRFDKNKAKTTENKTYVSRNAC